MSGLRRKIDLDPDCKVCRPQNWRISLSELLRLIQLYNAGGYHVDPGEGHENMGGRSLAMLTGLSLKPVSPKVSCPRI